MRRKATRLPEDIQELDPSVLSAEAKALESWLLSKIIGQDKAISQLVKVYQHMKVGLNRDNRPLGVFLFAGPTGTGKTECVKQVAKFLLGNENAITRIDCGEFQERHEVSKLIGAPPGYVGYSEQSSVRLAQENVDKFQTPENKINILLFDEIEEAHDALFGAILQILDAGRLTLGSGKTTDFTKTIVVMTSNIGERETQNKLAGKTLGLAVGKEAAATDDDIYRLSKQAATKHFKAKFMNRIDRVIVFRALAQESLMTILNNELNGIQARIWHSAYRNWEAGGKVGSVPFFRPSIKVTDAAKTFLLAEGTDQKYGARELNRALDRFVVFPIGSLIGSKQIAADDIIQIDHEEGKKKLTFRRIGKRDLKALQPAPEPKEPEPSEPNEPKEPKEAKEKKSSLKNSTDMWKELNKFQEYCDYWKNAPIYKPPPPSRKPYGK